MWKCLTALVLALNMEYKEGVRIEGITENTIHAIAVTARLMHEHDLLFVVTSVMDGEHSPNSKHNTGDAFDFRTRHMVQGQAIQIRAHVQEALGPDYDVVLEVNHLHVEYHPK